MTLGRLLRWILVIVLLVLAWSQARPWLEERLGRPGVRPVAAGAGADPREAAGCLALARATAGAYGDALGDFARRRDADEWALASGALHDRIDEAGAACACAGDACRLATEALRELSAALDETDLLVGGRPDAFIDPARELEGVYALLDRAREAR